MSEVPEQSGEPGAADAGGGDGGADAPPPGWENRVEYSDGGSAHRPHEILCGDRAGRDAVIGLIEAAGGEVGPDDVDPPIPEEEAPAEDPDEEYRVRHELLDVNRDVPDLQSRGFDVEPNQVVFIHSDPCGCGCCGGCPRGHLMGDPMYANPMYANPMYANPMYANPMYANPMYANPMYANPMYANPVKLSQVYASPMYANPMYANEYRKTGKRAHSAQPARDPKPRDIGLPAPGNEKVFVLDTGMAPADQLPALLVGQIEPDPTPPADEDPPARSAYLDPANGHGTFIAGIIVELARGRKPISRKVIESMGDGDVWKIGNVLKGMAAAGEVDDHTVLNLSFGGYADKHMKKFARDIRRVQARGAVVVASAGNDATCRKMYPACLPDVVGVAALAWNQPAPFSNFGPWVRACAPGTDLVSAFYRDYNGALPELPLPGAGDPDDFEGWARWSGTSFAAPIVAAVLLRTMALTGCNAREAVQATIDAPGLYRLAGYGTVVNTATTFSEE